MIDTAFLQPDEQGLAHRFMSEGFVTRPADDRAGLDRIQRRAAELAADYLHLPHANDPYDLLETIHSRVSPAELNGLRMHVIGGLNAEPWLRPTYFRLARSTIETIVGNELCMQRRVNLSIQLPADDSSLLATHSDVWSGDSPFEVVVWVPLVDVYSTKSMFLLPPQFNGEMQDRMASLRSAEELYKTIKPHLVWIDIPYGHVMVFNQTLMHGNRVNEEKGTRWSMNCRFKSIMSPYADKRFGEFFEPISLRPATRIGMQHKLPGGFNG
jgi:sporadic carbohydrate cluster 2OG-Fe(II) oxygenase